jgi:hypothetical protein
MEKTAPKGFERITKGAEVSPADLHPRGNAGSKFRGRDLPAWGGSDGEESNFKRCKQCGFILNKKVNQPGSGWGNDNFVPITTLAGGTANVEDNVSTAGCPFCSASEY